MKTFTQAHTFHRKLTSKSKILQNEIKIEFMNSEIACSQPDPSK